VRKFHLTEAVGLLVTSANQPGRDLQMPGEPHYKPKDLRPYLGYDQRVGWQIIVEWAWLRALAHHKIIPPQYTVMLTSELLAVLLAEITTTKVTALERQDGVGHDIIALLMLMRELLPNQLHPFLHWGLTSYDTISCAYALAARQTFKCVFEPKCQEVDELWRQRIGETAEKLQIGRTHLQHGLPITIGAWLTPLHRRFINTVKKAGEAVKEIHGKFSGAQGTNNALKVLAQGVPLEKTALAYLDLPEAEPATQLPLPEGMARFYSEITFISAALAGLGEDVRHLQSSDIEEIGSEGSTSSTMSHKTSNPIAAENQAGMHKSVRCEYYKVLETMNSDLQRDLRYSNVMRGYPAVMVFTYQQLLTVMRVFKSFRVNEQRCQENFWRNGKLVVAELLHLTLQIAGYPDARKFVNDKIVPLARGTGSTLDVAMDTYLGSSEDVRLLRMWTETSPKIKHILAHPEEYLGDSVSIAQAETTWALDPMRKHVL